MKVLEQIAERIKLKLNLITTAINDFIATKNVANGLAGLDATGKINPAQLPPLAISDTFPVADEASMLALTAERGDVAIRSDENKSYILATDDPTQLVNWIELKTPATGVTTFNSRNGAVVLLDTDVTTVLGTYAEFQTAFETGLL